MALLTSHLPFLYCMLCYRSNRPNLWHHVDRLINLLDNDPMSRYNGAILGSNTAGKEDFAMTDSYESVGRGSRMGQHRGRQSWMWHERNWDLEKICNRSGSQRYSRTQKRQQGNSGHSKTNNCFTKEPEDIRQMLPNRFLTVEELRQILPRKPGLDSKLSTQQTTKPVSRFTLNAGLHQDMKFLHPHCGACYTEIGYEVLSEITDFQGQNHTVLNFQNAYQFIAAGRCLNENSPCGGGGNARCTQVYRAHWILVWAPSKGTQLVAHEVPSHCECTNVGAALSTQEPMKNLKRSLPTFNLGNN